MKLFVNIYNLSLRFFLITIVVVRIPILEGILLVQLRRACARNRFAVTNDSAIGDRKEGDYL